jgi:hypothetical protein
MRKALLITTAISSLFAANISANAAENNIESINKEIQQLRSSYEDRIKQLEARLQQLEKAEAEKIVTESQPVPQANQPQQATSSPAGTINANTFNPAISAVLNGTFGAYSQKENEIAGFGTGHEGERPKKGLSLGETEVTASANIDNMFAGSVTAALADHDGETEVHLEEAYIQSIGLPYGLSVKAGRMLASLGYMNEKHRHEDDFVDRSLPYRVFLDNSFNDDGIQVSAVLPTEFYSEIGAGLWRGDDHPGAEAQGSKPGAYSGFARIGGDIGDNQSWRLGTSYLHTEAAGGGRETGEHGAEQVFIGDNDIFIADAKYSIAPTGNAKESEVTVQGEYFIRRESGTYDDTAIPTGPVDYKDAQSGWYLQTVYKFLPQWRVGYRYTGLNAPDVPAGLVGTSLDADGHNPNINSVMLDYSNSEFSRVRLQYNHDRSGRETDNQYLVQYIMSLGAHGAHKY